MKTKIILFSLPFLLAFMPAKRSTHSPVFNKGSITATVQPANAYWLRNNDSNDLYFYVHLKAGENSIKPETEKERSPLNLSLVIDKSGSMQGDKIMYTKKAVSHVIDQLSPGDILSVVEYSDNVRVTIPITYVTDKHSLKNKVMNIVAGGSTNLSGGMVKGFNLVAQAKNSWLESKGSNYINRVMLLSDGLANKGVIDSPGLTRLVSDEFEKSGATISTFGVGADYNEDLMTAIAVAGAGKYYFIDSPSKIPTLFEEELQGISNASAKNVELEIEFPADMVEFVGVQLFPFNRHGNKVKIKLADLFANEQRSILLRFKVKNELKERLAFQTTLNYSNPHDNMNWVSEKTESQIVVTEDRKLFNSGYNKDADMGYALMIGGELFEEAMKMADSRRFPEAENKLKEATAIMEDHFSRFKPHPYLKKVYDDMIAYEGTLETLQKTKNRSTYSLIQKGSKAKRFRSISCPSF